MPLYWDNKKVSLYLGDKRVKLSIGTTGGLPAGYTELEYIQSTGSQYINIPYYFSNTDEMYAKVAIDEVLSLDDKYFISPSQWNTNNNRFALGGFHKNRFTAAYGSFPTGNTKYTPLTGTNNAFHEYHYADKLFEMIDLGCQCDVANITWGENTTNLRLFYGYNAPTKCKIAAIWHKRAGAFLYNLIPAKRNSDGVLGMYDLVSKTFFTNVGTGSFTGPTISGNASVMALSLDEIAPEAEIQDEPQEDLEQE